MNSKSWTILLFSHNGRRSRGFRITIPVLCLLAAFIFSLLYFPGRILVSSLIKVRNIHELARLEGQNSKLRRHVCQFDEEIVVLDTRFDSLLDENQIFRQIAGLDKLEPEVLKVGIGGTSIDLADDLLEIDSKLARRINSQNNAVDELLRRAGLVEQSVQDAYSIVSEVSRRWRHLPSLTPTTGYISSTYGQRMHPLFHQIHYHTGLDFSTPAGQPIIAPADGKVVHSGKSQGLGLALVIDHDFGIKTVYGHCSRLVAKFGQDVHRGDVIAYVGRSGITTGPHLHYEVHVNGLTSNPFPYLLDTFPDRL